MRWKGLSGQRVGSCDGRACGAGYERREDFGEVVEGDTWMDADGTRAPRARRPRVAATGRWNPYGSRRARPG